MPGIINPIFQYLLTPEESISPIPSCKKYAIKKAAIIVSVILLNLKNIVPRAGVEPARPLLTRGF